MEIKISKEKKQKIFNVMFIFAFIFYVAFIIDSTLFKYDTLINIVLGNRFAYLRSINLIPFFDANADKISLIKDIAINSALFIPFGYLMQIKSKNNRITIMQIFIPFTLSIIIEILQYTFLLGISDITDLICNTFGSILGVIAYILFNKAFKDKIQLLNVVLITILGLGCALLVVMRMFGYVLVIWIIW